MKIKKENQLGLNFTQHIKDEFYRIHSEKFFAGLPEDFLRPFRQQWIDILSDKGNKNLLFTKTSMEVADKIKINRFEPSILKIKKEKKLTFLIDGNHFYRVMLAQDEIFVLHIKKTILESGHAYISYESFKIMPLLNTVVYPPNQTDYLNDKFFKEFLRLLIFTEYSELEETLVNPRQSYGTKKQGKYLNESNQPFIIVDSHWNKIIVRNDGFGVSGHIRLVKRNGVKLVWVSSYQKNGYIRKSKKNEI